MKTKTILAWTLVSSLAIVWVAWASFGWFWKWNFDRESVKNMSSEERQVFMEERKAVMEAKRSEMAERKAGHFEIMTKLLNREELTAEEESVLEEMKAHRVERFENMWEYKRWFSNKKRGMMRWWERFAKQKEDREDNESL